MLTFILSSYVSIIYSLLLFSSVLSNLFLDTLCPCRLVGLESQMNNAVSILPKSPQPNTPLSRRSGMPTYLWHVPVDLHQRRVYLSGILMQSNMLDTVKQKQMLVKSYSSVSSWHLTTSWPPVVNFHTELPGKAFLSSSLV